MRADFSSRRSSVLATGGMVATSHPLAAQAGLEILRDGGNAADAAVATAAVLNVVEPTATGIGGDCFALFFDAATKRVHAVNGSGRAPAGLTIEELARRGARDEVPRHSALSVTVPGTAAGWSDTVERHGTLALSGALAPAIRIAEEGHPVAPLVAWFWERGAERLRTASPHAGAFLPEGRAPRAGESFRNPDLASVFRELAQGGPAAFYSGRAAREIVRVLADLGGVLGADDLAAHRSTFEGPIQTTYRGHTVHECAPNGQGLAALIALGLAEGFDLAAMGPRSADALHTLIECMRLAFADARWYVADPSVVPVPVEELLSKNYSAQRRKSIDPARAALVRQKGGTFPGSDTVYLAVVDGDGNACSFINSNYQGFGTGIVPRGCGFTLQNRGAGFHLDPAHPNVLAPGKRPYHTIIPAISTTASGDLHACFGVMGGFMQPQGHLQVFVNLVDHGMGPQEALDEPRFRIEPDAANAPVLLEEGVADAVADDLGARGHVLRRVTGIERTYAFGRGQVILRDPVTGVLAGGSDGRCDGAAVGY